MKKQIFEFFEELKFDIKNIGIDLLPLEKRTVLLGTGSFDAPIIFIGDDENLFINEEGEVDELSTGEFLLKLLDLEDINRDKYYITTLSKRRVKFSTFIDEDRDTLIDILYTQIAIMKPKIIVLLGMEVFNIFFKGENFEDYLATFTSWKGDIKALVTYDVGTVLKARTDQGKKSIVAKNFWLSIKNLKSKLEDLKNEN